MATTNIHLAKTPEGKPFQFSDISQGSKATFPSGAGGVITCECVERTATHAVFKSAANDWPSTWTIRLGAKDLSLKDFENLALAIKNYDNGTCSDSERGLVNRAQTLGYAVTQSYTQASWTELGIKTMKSLQAEISNVVDDHGLADQLLNKIISAEDAFELKDVIGDLKIEEKVLTIQRLLTADSLV